MANGLHKLQRRLPGSFLRFIVAVLTTTCGCSAWAPPHVFDSQVGAVALAATADEDLESGLLHAVVHCSAAAYEAGAIDRYPRWNELNLKLLGEPFEVPEQLIRGFVVRRGKQLIVAFRGTVITEIENWKTNIDLKPVPITPKAEAEIHSGFRNAYLLVKPKLTQILRDAQQPDDRIIYTGHSLGGALAVMAAQDLAHMEAKPRIYTFGQPQVGNAAFAKTCPGKLYRFVHDKDPVARVPEIRGYEHFGELIYFNNEHERASRSKGLVILKTSIAAYQRLKEIRTSAKQNQSLAQIAREQGGDAGKFLAEAVGDHSMTKHYIPCIEQNFPIRASKP